MYFPVFLLSHWISLDRNLLTVTVIWKLTVNETTWPLENTSKKNEGYVCVCVERETERGREKERKRFLLEGHTKSLVNSLLQIQLQYYNSAVFKRKRNSAVLGLSGQLYYYHLTAGKENRPLGGDGDEKLECRGKSLLVQHGELVPTCLCEWQKLLWHYRTWSSVNDLLDSLRLIALFRFNSDPHLILTVKPVKTWLPRRQQQLWVLI